MQIKENTISCDFDGSLDDDFDGTINPNKKKVKDFVSKLIRRGYYVYIITRRYGPENSSMGTIDEHLAVWKIAEELGIPKERVIFTNRKWKYSFIESIGACMHIDDDKREGYWIERHLPRVTMVCLEDNNWNEQIVDVITEHNKIGIWIQNKRNIFSIIMLSLITIFIILLSFS